MEPHLHNGCLKPFGVVSLKWKPTDSLINDTALMVCISINSIVWLWWASVRIMHGGVWRPIVKEKRVPTEPPSSVTPHCSPMPVHFKVSATYALHPIADKWKKPPWYRISTSLCALFVTYSWKRLRSHRENGKGLRDLKVFKTRTAPPECVFLWS